VAVTPADLLQPYGPVSASFYPDDAPPPATGPDTVLGRLAAYIARATDEVAALGVRVREADRPAAVKAWALYLAHDDAYTIKLAKPATKNAGDLGLGGTGFITEQFKGLKEKRDGFLVDFRALVVEAAPVAVVQPLASSSVPVSFGSW
jgi:hypothetical protein